LIAFIYAFTSSFLYSIAFSFTQLGQSSILTKVLAINSSTLSLTFLATGSLFELTTNANG
jgi:hypothetical protein